MKTLVVFGHGLGDAVVFASAIKNWYNQKGYKLSIAMQKRFEQANIWKNCPYLEETLYILSDPWHDFGHLNTRVGFPSILKEGEEWAKEHSYDEVLMVWDSPNNYLVQNYNDMLGLEMKDADPEVWISEEDKIYAKKEVERLVGNNKFAWIQTHSSDFNRSIPENYARFWAKERGINHFIEIGKEIGVKEHDYIVQCAMAELADMVIAPNSGYWHAFCSKSMNIKTDLLYFSRGKGDFTKRNYYPHYKWFNSVTYDLEIVPGTFIEKETKIFYDLRNKER